jgi:hypothetical protein
MDVGTLEGYHAAQDFLRSMKARKGHIIEAA